MTIDETIKDNQKDNMFRSTYCMWFILSLDDNSTTFQDVAIDDNLHPLYKCKYLCTGLKDNYCFRDMPRRTYSD